MNLLKCMITTTLITLNVAILFQTNRLIIPVMADVPDQRIEQALEKMGVSENRTERIATGVRIASIHHNISPEFIIALTHTESSFNQYAVSSKNYKGYMQIPHSIWEPAENFLIGARIMKEKLTITNGDLKKAICLYKGWPVDSTRGRYEADKVLKLYDRLVKI